MKGIKKILVPLDFSDCSKYAFNYALDIARDGKAEIFLLHIIDMDLLGKISDIKLCPKAKAKKLMEKNAKTELDKLVKVSTQKHGISSIREIIEDGIPFLQILKKAKDLDIDLIIMGTFGTSTPMRRLFFGSTTERVLKGAKVPVLCIPLPQTIEG